MPQNTPNSVVPLPNMPERIVRIAIRSTDNLYHAQHKLLHEFGIMTDLNDLHQFKKTFKDEP